MKRIYLNKYKEIWGEYEENMRKICGKYEENMRRIWGEYEENMRRICIKYEENMRRIWGEYEENKRRIWGKYMENMRKIWGESEFCNLIPNMQQLCSTTKRFEHQTGDRNKSRNVLFHNRNTEAGGSDRIGNISMKSKNIPKRNQEKNSMKS